MRCNAARLDAVGRPRNVDGTELLQVLRLMEKDYLITAIFETIKRLWEDRLFFWRWRMIWRHARPKIKSNAWVLA